MPVHDEARRLRDVRVLGHDDGGLATNPSETLRTRRTGKLTYPRLPLNAYFTFDRL
jgi:hypothetical protein